MTKSHSSSTSNPSSPPENKVNPPYDQIPGLSEIGEILQLVSLSSDTSAPEIQLHHIFRLQLMVDSFTILRGWACDIDHGHDARKALPAAGYHHDLDLVFGDNAGASRDGLRKALRYLSDRLTHDSQLHQDPGRHRKNDAVLHHLRQLCDSFPYHSQYKERLPRQVPSRFSKTSQWGLWDYSPMLCGLSMLDVLERQRQAGMQLWTTLPELAMVPLLYNKFELSGRLPSPVPALLEVVKVFGKVIVERTKELAAGPFSRQKAVTMSSHSKKRSSTKIKKGKILVRSLLQSLREVGWHPVLIPNIDLFEHTGLACIRLSDCDLNEEGKDVGTVDLIRRFKEEPHNVRSLGLLKEVYRAVQEGTRATAASWREEYSRVVPSAQFLEDLGDRDHSSPGATTHHGVPYSDVLHQLVHDIHDELCGESPNTGVHYVWLSGYAMRIFEMIEERLEAAHDPIWRAAYCEDRMYAKDKRQRLCHLACSDNVHGTETAKIIAGVFRDTNDDHQATFWGEKSKSSTGYQERQVAGGNSMYISSCSGDGESKCGDVLRPCDQMDG